MTTKPESPKNKADLLSAACNNPSILLYHVFTSFHDGGNVKAISISMTLVLLALAGMLYAQDQSQTPKAPTTLKGVLLEQLRTTHTNKDWFVDANTAVSGLSPEQASWTDGKGNHSVGQLAYHLVFWNQRELTKFKGQKPDKFSGNNDETFNNFDAKKWADTQQQLDQVMKDLEATVEAMDDTKLAENASEIAHIGTHNAYHIGQIVFVRKEQGSWNPEKGVK